MDEEKLKQVLRAEVIPPAEDNARKAAINLAMAAFDEAQNEKRKNRQGSGRLARLMGRNRSRTGGWNMRKSYLLGGVATAAVLMAVSITTLRLYPQPQYFAKTTGAEQLAHSQAAPAESQAAKPQVGKRKAALPQAAQPQAGQAGEPKRPVMELADQSVEQAPPLPQGGLVRAPLPSVVDRISEQMFRGQSKSAQAPSDATRPSHYQDVGRDSFESVVRNPVKRVAEDPVSTFSIDVDTASYAFVRRQLNSGLLPQKDAVRVEELLNYFDYAYPLPESREQPFRTSVTVQHSPWKAGNKLIHIGIKGYDLAPAEKPRSNLVFLLDVSGSMNAPDKLPLMVNSMKLLLDSLGPDDRVAIVVYAGAAGTVLAPTKVAEKHKILAALDRLSAGGSTAGAEGVRQAYALAEANLDRKAVNRVILATDGDFNVGITNREALQDFIERKRASGVFLSVLGFGQGNLNDYLMQTLAQTGNGVAAHIDTLNEARKVLVEEAASTLFPIAKDVKIQVEFNPKTVAEYRLIGYETRALARADFNNDKVDAGDIGAGHTVTAIYEITPLGGESGLIEPSRYQAPGGTPGETALADEYAFLKIRYKLPDQDRSTLVTTPITVAEENLGDGDAPRAREARWATAVAGFGQILTGGKYTAAYGYDEVIALAQGAKGDDRFGYRAEFINLVRLARSASALPRN